jgi:hypothetical protein
VSASPGVISVDVGDRATTETFRATVGAGDDAPLIR